MPASSAVMVAVTQTLPFFFQHSYQRLVAALLFGEGSVALVCCFFFFFIPFSFPVVVALGSYLAFVLAALASV